MPTRPMSGRPVSRPMSSKKPVSNTHHLLLPRAADGADHDVNLFRTGTCVETTPRHHQEMFGEILRSRQKQGIARFQGNHGLQLDGALNTQSYKEQRQTILTGYSENNYFIDVQEQHKNKIKQSINTVPLQTRYQSSLQTVRKSQDTQMQSKLRTLNKQAEKVGGQALIIPKTELQRPATTATAAAKSG